MHFYLIYTRFLCRKNSFLDLKTLKIACLKSEKQILNSQIFKNKTDSEFWQNFLPIVASYCSGQFEFWTHHFKNVLGSIATIPMGVISYKTKKPVLVTKLCVVGIILSLGLLNYFIRFQNESGWNKFAIIISCISLGVFALGSYPLALELVVECTYPVDQVQ